MAGLRRISRTEVVLLGRVGFDQRGEYIALIGLLGALFALQILVQPLEGALHILVHAERLHGH